MGLGGGGGGIPAGAGTTFQNYLMANPQLSRMIASGALPTGVAFQMFQGANGTPYPGPGMPGMIGGGAAGGPPPSSPINAWNTGGSGQPAPVQGPVMNPTGAMAVPQGPGAAAWQLPPWMQSMALNPWTSQMTPSAGVGTIGQMPTGAAQNIPGAFSVPGSSPAAPLPGGAAGGGTFNVLPYPQVAPITGTGAPTTSPLAPGGPVTVQPPAPAPTGPSQDQINQMIQNAVQAALARMGLSGYTGPSGPNMGGGDRGPASLGNQFGGGQASGGGSETGGRVSGGDTSFGGGSPSNF